MNHEMSRREFMGRTGAALAAGMLPIMEGMNAKAAESARPNILLIITDQQHAGMLSCAGNPWLKTPNMDALAAHGVRFERAYCGNPVCVPSRFTMMTGTLPSAIGMEHNGQIGNPVPETIMRHSLGRVFREAGYETVYGGKTHLPRAASIPGGKKARAGKGKMMADYGFDAYLTADERGELARTGADFLRQKHDRSFLLVASLINPHDICYMGIHDYEQRNRPDRESFYRAFASNVLVNKGTQTEMQSEREAFAPGRMEAFVKTHCPPLPPNFEIPRNEPEGVETQDWRPFRAYERRQWGEAQWRLHRWAYARLTEQVDREIGVLLGGLRESGHERDTLVVLVSDHGDMDGAHRLEHKSMLYEEATHVPFIVSLPGVTRAGAVERDHLASTGLDLIPSLCDFAGVAIPEALAGRSVRPLAEGRRPAEWRDMLVVENEGSRLARWGETKYVVYAQGRQREQLVDLRQDPGEMQNLALDLAHREVLVEGRRRLRHWYLDHGLKLDPIYIIDEHT